MFRNSESNTAVLENLEVSSRVAAKFRKRGVEVAKREGLCCNCDLRESCLYPAARGAVWFCEEYQ